MIAWAYGHLIVVNHRELRDVERQQIEEWKGATFYFPNTKEADEFINYLREEAKE